MLPVMPALPNNLPIGGAEPVSPEQPGTDFAAMLATEVGSNGAASGKRVPGPGFEPSPRNSSRKPVGDGTTDLSQLLIAPAGVVAAPDSDLAGVMGMDAAGQSSGEEPTGAETAPQGCDCAGKQNHTFAAEVLTMADEPEVFDLSDDSDSVSVKAQSIPGGRPSSAVVAAASGTEAPSSARVVAPAPETGGVAIGSQAMAAPARAIQAGKTATLSASRTERPTVSEMHKTADRSAPLLPGQLQPDEMRNASIFIPENSFSENPRATVKKVPSEFRPELRAVSWNNGFLSPPEAGVSSRPAELPGQSTEKPAAAITPGLWIAPGQDDLGVVTRIQSFILSPELQEFSGVEPPVETSVEESGTRPAAEGESHRHSLLPGAQNNIYGLSRTQPPVAPVLQIATAKDHGSPLPVSFEHLLNPNGKEHQVTPGQEFSSPWSGLGTTATGGWRSTAVAASTPSAATYPAASGGGQIVDQVVSRVKLAGTGEETSLSLTLHPKELGEVRIELVADKDGLRAHLHSQNQQVQDALEKHLPRLREAFAEQGLKVHDLQVSCDSRRDGGGAFGHGRDLLYQGPTRVERGGSGEELGREWLAEPPPAASGWSNQPGFSLRV